MAQKEFTQASVAYRKFRERCGVKDPVMLDEIEEAYFIGAEETINRIEEKLDFYCDRPSEFYGAIERMVKELKGE